MPLDRVAQLERPSGGGPLASLVNQKVREHVRRLGAEKVVGARANGHPCTLCDDASRAIIEVVTAEGGHGPLDDQLVDRWAQRYVTGHLQLHYGLDYLSSECARRRALLAIVRLLLNRHMLLGADLTPMLHDVLALAANNFEHGCEEIGRSHV